jgi:CHAT domain-containing protein
MINNLGNVNQRMGNYSEAEIYHLQSIKLQKDGFGEKTEGYALALNNLAWLYYITGKYPSGEKLYLQSLGIYKEIFGEENKNYARTLDNLGGIYSKTGNYSMAEKVYQLSLKIRQKILGEESWDYGSSLNNLALLYYSLGNYSAAEPMFNKASLIVKNKLGDKHPQYAIAVGNLASLYEKTNDYTKAERFAKQEIAIQELSAGKNSATYATSLNNLALLYFRTGKDTTIEQLLSESLTIRKKTLGTEHVDYANSLNNIGQYYTSIGKYAVADSLFAEAKSIREKILADNNPDYLSLLKNQSHLFQMMGNYQSANEVSISYLQKEKNQLLDKLDFLSESELISYLKQREPSLMLPYSSLWQFNFPQLVQAAYNSRLVFKGVSIQNTNSLSNQMEQSKDSLIIKLVQDYKSNKSILIKTLAQPFATRTINTDSLSKITNQQEKDLLRQLADYRNMKANLNIVWQDVLNKLKPGETAIEFIQFNQLKRKNHDPDTVFYAALLLRSGDTIPVFIKLFDEKTLKNVLTRFPYKTAGGSNAKGNNGNSKKSIYNLLWQPLETYLKNSTTIYFAPDGLLHNLSFAAIPDNKAVLLCEKYNLIQLTSTRQVVLQDDNTKSPSSIVLFGGINYNKQTTDTTITASADPYSYVYRQNRSGDLDSFFYLPATLTEVQKIKGNMQLKQKKVTSFIGDKATEAAFRTIGGAASPDVIHFATHAFTLSDTANSKSGNNTFKISDNPLLRSGLIMAGGNKGWKGKSNLDEDDGILTALEITSVPLPNTRLAVLSACETGVGELRGSEGIFGLQRAFKLAGVNYIMASLWQVPDKETSLFMNLFYTHWLNGKTIRQAFTTAQQTMRKKYPPFYWAAFTLVQ